MPRRVSRKSKGSHAPAKTREPLAEGIVPLDKRGRRNWVSMSDDELVIYGKRFMEENRISGRRELFGVDPGLYSALQKRKLLDEVGFENKHAHYRNWYSMSNNQLVAYAKKFMKKNKISGKKELYKADSGLYQALRVRKLLDRIGFEEKYRDWSSLSGAQLVEHARRFMKENGISGRGELYKADGGLYQALRVRKLLNKVGFEERRKDWSSLSDAQLIEYAKQFMEERGIRGRHELEKAYSRLYQALRVRKLLGRVGFEEKKRPQGFFSKMSDEELVVFAKKVVEEKEIMSRWGLGKDDKVLYEVLRIRNLLDRVFADIEKAKEKEEAQALLDGLMEFSGAG